MPVLGHFMAHRNILESQHFKSEFPTCEKGMTYTSLFWGHVFLHIHIYNNVICIKVIIELKLRGL